MPPKLSGALVDALSPFDTLSDPELEGMRAAAIQFAHDIWGNRKRGRWLTLTGRSGTGKTLLARHLMRFIERNLLRFSPGYGITLTDNSCVVKWGEAVARMKSGDFCDAEILCDKETKWDNSVRAIYRFALIDDIGQPEDSSKGYVVAALGRIADARLGEWTIWTSNLYLQDIAAIEPRLASRMIRDGNVVIENHCQDFNLRKPNQKQT